MKRVLLIAVGDELLSGIRREENCGWLAGRLAASGWEVERIEILPDIPGSLLSELEHWTGRVDLAVISGGLGPTHDDRTREAVSNFLSSPLRVDDKAYDRLLSRYSGSLREMLERSRSSQGAVPECARAVHNPAGWALGISFSMEGTRFLAFPGVPAEFRAMAEQELGGELFPREGEMESLFVVGWTESLLKDRISEVTGQSGLHVSILPSPGIIELVLRGEADHVGAASERLRALLPGDCLPPGASSLEDAVLRTARRNGLKVSCAESCTGGLVGAFLSSVAGSSDVFTGSAVCYSNGAKKSILGVSDRVLACHGAVSGECAREMAAGAVRVFGSDLAVSVTGIAGPEGGSAEKPVGTVWFATADRSFRTDAVKLVFPGDRDCVRNRARTAALEILWRRLEAV